jgi:lipid-A-disaccharide synthase
MKQVMMVAAEASSGLFGQRLIEFWKKSKKDIHFFGVGTQEMESLGLERLGKSEEMAVVGVSEIIEHWGKLKSVFNSLLEECKKRKPSVVILMDYPEFNLYLARKIKQLGLDIPVIYYVSPQVWAWRKGRVHTIKKFCRKVFLLFPFEIPFYQSKGVPFDFVGHPILDEIQEKYYNEDYRVLHRTRCGIGKDDIVLGLMPGSRRIEVREHLKIQLEVARRLTNEYPNLKVLLMVAPTFSKEQIQDQLQDIKFPIIVQKDEPLEMIHLTDFVLVASGTATLQVGLLEKPMVIMYKISLATWIFAKIFVRGVKFVGLVNLILGKEAVPERLQFEANPDELCRQIKKYIDNKAYTESVRADLKKIRPYLGDKGATQRVAGLLEEYLKD